MFPWCVHNNKKLKREVAAREYKKEAEAGEQTAEALLKWRRSSSRSVRQSGLGLAANLPRRIQHVASISI